MTPTPISDLITFIILGVLCVFGAALVWFWVVATAEQSKSRLRATLWRMQRDAERLHADDAKAIYDRHWQQYMDREGPYADVDQHGRGT